MLTGLLKCGHCGNGLTVATGKGGRYKYYKCTNKRNKGNVTCNSKNLPMEDVDQTILRQIANKAFAPERIQMMMTELRNNSELTSLIRSNIRA